MERACDRFLFGQCYPTDYLFGDGRTWHWRGGGDVKLMAVAGLVIGWKACIVAFIVGCIAGSIIHVIRMKVSGANHRLALGPYLSMGIWFAMLFSEPIIEWYLRLCGLA